MNEQSSKSITGYTLINLKELIEQVGEEQAKSILSDFSCPMNSDVEYFLQTKAIEFAKQGIAQSHLVFVPYRGNPALVGYFTLSNKAIVVPKENLSSSKWRRRINRFAHRYVPDGDYVISAPLIGQLGKNFSHEYNRLIPGDVLLRLATDKVQMIQASLGGKFVYLECENKSKLIDFYSENGFVIFGNRPLERDERDRQSGEYLVQLLKYLS